MLDPEMIALKEFFGIQLLIVSKLSAFNQEPCKIMREVNEFLLTPSNSTLRYSLSLQNQGTEKLNLFLKFTVQT